MTAPEQYVTIHHRGAIQTVKFAEYQDVLAALVAERGGWELGVSRIEFNAPAPEAPAEAPVVEDAPAPAAPLANSTFSHTVEDAEAKARIEAQHETLAKAGITVDTSQQFFATGTRLADIGYQTQAQRRAEHNALKPLREVAADLDARIQAEKRVNKVILSGDIAKGLAINGKLSFDGYNLQEQAIRGLLARIESPATSFIFGVRERLRQTEEAGLRQQDKSIILRTLIAELERNPKVECNLRVREGLGDIFACVSPAYGEADAPTVLPVVLASLAAFGDDLKANASYDPATTAWEIRAQVHTPTPDELQAVGEPFRGYVSLRSKDNGTGKLGGGGGIEILRCLNASVYVADGHSASRVHRKGIVLALDKLVATAAKNISALCEAWGVARQETLNAHLYNEQQNLIPIEEVITGFYRYTLTERRGELVGAIPGRSEVHAKGLAKAYFDQRRDEVQVTRGDLAQGYTRYIQNQPLAVQQQAEGAVADWLINRPPVRYLAS